MYGTLTIVSLIGMFELYRAVKVQKQGENLLAVVGYLGVILHYILLSLGYSEYADDELDHCADRHDVCLCVFLSEISCRTGDGSLFRCGLCGVSCCPTFIRPG